jgi:hypothetical protein
MREINILYLGLLFSTGCDPKGDGVGEVSDSGGGPWRPEVVCPGDPTCPDADGPLFAGASAVSITPTCFEAWRDCGDDGLCPGDSGYVEADGGEGDAEYDSRAEAFLDCGCDRLCPGDDGYPGADEGEADGEFMALWLAGFQSGRPANSVHDDIWARAAAFQKGGTTVAIVSLDVVGFFYDDVLKVRAAVAAQGVDVDHIIVTSTHVHEGPDTMGQWGPNIGTRGVDEAWFADVIRNTAKAVERAVAALEPASLTVGAVDISTDSVLKGTQNQVDDHRDPRIVDEWMNWAILRDAEGATIASMVNFANHPESLSDENTAITSDFVHYVRDGMENGVPWESGPLAGLSGVCLYIQGAVGGMMTPLGVTVTDWDGVDHSTSDFSKAKALGFVMASQVLVDQVDKVPETDPGLALRAAEMFLPIENYAFQAAFLMGLFDRAAYNYDEDSPLGNDNRPELRSEIDVFDLGPIRMLTVPGELLPELAVGGYDGAHTNIGSSSDQIVDPENPNPPALDAAPPGPYIKERMGAPYNWIVGLGNDEVGYIIPVYNFKTHDRNPWFDEPEGDHYEETNSLGPETAPLVEAAVDQLLDWSP